MKRRQTPSIDGFIPRRPMSSTDSMSGETGLRRSADSSRGLDQGTPAPSQPTTLRPESHHGMTRADVAAALADIDSANQQNASDSDKPPQKRRFRLDKRLTKRLLIVVGVVLLLAGAFVGIKALIAAGNIFRGDLLGLVQAAPLKTDANGRSNILVFGTSEDNYEGGVQHEGAHLTDSIMVVSIHQEKHDAYMISLPRDLWVRYDGRACSAGYEGKLNEYYGCYSDDGSNEQAGAEAFKSKAAEITGLDIQYYAHLNYTVVERAVDAVGGVSVEINSDDPRGIFDPNFDWRCNHQCNYVKYPNGPTGTMDGEHALALARARNAQGGYGLQRGNFDREQYQQKIIRALVEKSVSVGTVTNLGKVTSLMDALGDNLRSNFETKEIRTLMRLAQDIPQDEMISIDLAKEGELAVEVGALSGISIVQPVSGLYDFSSIKNYIRQQMMQSDPVVREAAQIGVYNGSGAAGAARTAADRLQEQNLVVADVGNAPSGTYRTYEIYDLTGSKPATKQKLETLYGVSVAEGSPPLSVAGLDFVIIVGRALDQ